MCTCSLIQKVPPCLSRLSLSLSLSPSLPLCLYAASKPEDYKNNNTFLPIGCAGCHAALQPTIPWSTLTCGLLPPLAACRQMYILYNHNGRTSNTCNIVLNMFQEGYACFNMALLPLSDFTVPYRSLNPNLTICLLSVGCTAAQRHQTITVQVTSSPIPLHMGLAKCESRSGGVIFFPSHRRRSFDA